MSTPPPGTLVLYDDVQPPLTAGSYRAVSTTTVTVRGVPQIQRTERHIEVEAPRFSLPPSEIAAVYPPRNGHGAFHQTLPHIVLRRRSLPWERALDPSGRIPAPTRPAGEQAPSGQLPWMALLLLDDGEGQLLQGLPLEEVVPADVFGRLGAPAGVVCDALELDRPLLRALLPSKEEIQLLVHAREANADNRSLDAGDGFNAVVMANRLPKAGARHRVCLVSLEERSDLVVADPPAVGSDDWRDIRTAATAAAMMEVPIGIRPRDRVAFPFPLPPPAAARLVVLTSWTFEGGDATFPELMQRLDVGLFGKIPSAGGPALADTGHLPMALEDRAGVDQTVWYRSPLGPQQLARDTLGPYHSADQARRVSPETGAEDITYAAAFEVGRLLCAADARAAGELLRWRRKDGRESTRQRSIDRAAATLAVDPSLTAHLTAAPAAVLGASALARTAERALARADVSGVAGVQAAGLDPTALADAWALSSAAHAKVFLSPRPISTATAVVGSAVPNPNATANREATAAARERAIEKARMKSKAIEKEKAKAAARAKVKRNKPSGLKKSKSSAKRKPR